MHARRLAFIWAIAVAAPAAAIAQEFHAGFRVDRYSTDEGLPAHAIHDIVQSRNGFLWIATNGGLVRFDGRRFETIAPEAGRFHIGRVGGLDVGRGDTIWLTPESGGIAYVVGRQARLLVEGPVLYDLAQDRDGSLWLMHGPLSRYAAGRLDTVIAGNDFLYANFTERPRLWRDETGTLWARSQQTPSVEHRLRDGQFRTAEVDGTRAMLGNSVTGARYRLRTTGTERDVVGANNRRVATLPRDTERHHPRLVDRAGRVWTSVADTVEVFGPSSTRALGRFHLANAGHVSLMFEDREGNVWAGSARAGLWRFQPAPFTTLGVESGLAMSQALGIYAGASDEVLITDQSRQLFAVRGTRASKLPLPFLGEGPDVIQVVAERGGSTWYVLGGPEFQTVPRRLVLRDVSGQQREWDLGSTIHHARLDPRRDGVLWVRVNAGLVRLDRNAPGGPKLVRRYDFGSVGRGLLIATDGSIWATGEDAARRGAVWRLVGDSLHEYAASDGVPAAPTRDLFEDVDGTIWIGTYGAGLLRFKDGAFGRVTTAEGLADDVVSGILADDAGNLWFAGNRGVHRAARNELNAVLDGRAARLHGVLYGSADGLTIPEGSGRAPLRAADGRLWFPTFGGAAVVDPTYALSLDGTPPTVEIESLSADDEHVSMGADLRTPRGKRRVEIGYRGISMRQASRLGFERRLAPVDTQWVATGNDVSAIYAALRPGRYSFSVRAVNARGVASEPATLEFVVPPFFYETLWFWLVTLVLIVVAGEQLLRLRLRQSAARQIELRRLVEERTASLAAQTSRTEAALETVAAQAEQLRSLDQTKSRLFANVSHEFRTPLSLVIGPLEDLRAGRSGPLSDAIARTLDRALTNGRRLVRLVEQMLDVARLEAGALRLNLDTHDFVPLLRRIAESFSSLAEARGIQFRVAYPVGAVFVRFDPDHMDKVIANLCGNALKFTERGGLVELSLSVERGDSAVLSVRDTGVGIPESALPRVFDRFYQVDDSSRRAHEGTGIGLAIAKELMELHSGSIAVESQPGVGSTFTLRLPLANAAREAQGRGALPARATAHLDAAIAERTDDAANARDIAEPPDDRTTVLLVEDNTELRQYLAEHLADEYRVLEAADGNLGLAMARAQSPDLVISDVMMPEMDGQALCAALKSHPDTDFIPVVLLTARAELDERIAGLEGGADDYLTKPVEMRELLARVRNLIGIRRRLRERVAESGRVLPKLTLKAADALAGGGAEFLQQLNDVMSKHLGDEAFDADAMAAALATSRATLYRRLDELLGQSPMEALWQYRLDQAALWLRSADASVSEVAYAVGFKSVPHFSRRFKARFAASPGSYRRAVDHDASASQPASTRE